MNFTLFKKNAKNGFLLLLIFIGVLAMYISMIVSMYDPEEVTLLTTKMDMLPKELVSAMGFSDIATDLTGFIAGVFYGFLIFIFPMIYCIILGNKLVAKPVDNGSFAYILSTPNSRTKVIVTQGVYILSSILVMFIVTFAIGITTSEAMFKGLLDKRVFMNLNVTACLLTMAISMICYFFSCLFNDTKKSLAFGAGLPIAFLLLNMLGGVSTKADILKKMSLYSLFDANKIASGGSTLVINLIFIGIVVALFGASILVFNRKRLPL